MIAVEWLTEKLSKFDLSVTEKDGRVWNYGKINDSTYVASLFERAKAMEQEQIIDAFIDGEHQQGFEGEAEQYFNETYKKK
jgi:tRNA isopentenyl-2-thiomethyl-A-37 hydroxylase MiaE